MLPDPDPDAVIVERGLKRVSAGLTGSRSLNVFGSVWFVTDTELVLGLTLGWLETTDPPDSNLFRTRLTFPVQTGDGDRRRIDGGGGAGDTGLGLFRSETLEVGFGGFRIRATGSCRTSGTDDVLTSNLLRKANKDQRLSKLRSN